MATSQIGLRLDSELHDGLKQRAGIEGTNVSAEIAKAVRAHLGYAANREEQLSGHEDRIRRLEQLAGID